MNDMISLSRYRIFIAAIVISFLWHMFWLSAVKIVSAPSIGKPVKFSKVSFLGPFLARGAISLRVQPKEKGFLEKRYRMMAANTAGGGVVQQGGEVYRYEPDAGARLLDGRSMADFVDEALAGPRPEPDYSGE